MQRRVPRRRPARGAIRGRNPRRRLDRQGTEVRSLFQARLAVPKSRADHAPWHYYSAVYDGLRTNLPATVMALRDRSFPPGTPLFPKHSQVKDCQSRLSPSFRWISKDQPCADSFSHLEIADLQSYAQDLQ